jgi:two-component system, chemotaxis family, protein-glutamate methylesterase/glutaminase
MKDQVRRVVVIGTSMGGRDALMTLVGGLPQDLDAAILIVQHMAADTSGNVLVESLSKSAKLECAHACDGEKIRRNRIYVAPSDNHLLIAKGRIIVSKGARENRSRPAIDPLFRSAAVAYRSKVIAILLTGYLDDGTAGLIAVKRCGGICVVQDPADAAYPDMPRNAVNNLKVDHCVPLTSIAQLLVRLILQAPPKSIPVPDDIVLEAKIAERVLSDVTAVEDLGDQVPYNCPNCGGVLWKVKKGPIRRYRCHTGHAFTAAVLLAEQTKKIEETLWTALRMFEERKNLLNTMADPRSHTFVRSATERAKESQVHIERIRQMLWASGQLTDDVIKKR